MADDSKKRILFWPDVYKEQGHWLPTLSWAERLKDTYDIAYMGIADCQELISSYNAKNQTNFKYWPIFSSTYELGYTDKTRTTPSSRWKEDHLWSIAYSRYGKYKERMTYGASQKQAAECGIIRALLVGDYEDDSFEDGFDTSTLPEKSGDRKNPSLLVSGYFTALETLIFYYLRKADDKYFKKLDLNFAISTTYLRHPSEDPAMRAMQSLMALSPAARNKLINLVYPVDQPKPSGNDLIQEPDISLEEFVTPLSDFDELIPCPRDFEYSHYQFCSKVHFVEPCITKELKTIDDASADIDWKTILSKPKLVYVTAGSQVLDYEDKALSLFKSIIDAMQSADMNGYHLIVCVGSTLIEKETWKNYDNVTVCGWAPQREILNAISQKDHKGSCAIIHGGLATIKECVYYNVPFLVLPLGKDQIDNALRLENYGINNRFFVEFVKPKCLQYFINKIISDKQSLKMLDKLSKVFHAAEDVVETAGEKVLKDLLSATKGA